MGINESDESIIQFRKVFDYAGELVSSKELLRRYPSIVNVLRSLLEYLNK